MSINIYNVNAQVKKNVKKAIAYESPVKPDNIINSNIYQNLSPLLSPYPSITCYPKALDRTTGSVAPDGTITQGNKIHAIGDNANGANPGEQGWIKFDISSIPSGSFIVNVELHFYVDSTLDPFFYVNQVTSDPEIAAGSDLYTEITGAAGRYYNYTATQAAGWNVLTLSTTANADVQGLLAQQWWALGFYEYDVDPSVLYYFKAQGWNDVNKPYIVVTYSSVAVYDAQTTGLWMPSRIPIISLLPTFTAQSIPFKSMIVNNGTQAATFNDNTRIYKSNVPNTLYVTPVSSLSSGGILTLSGNYPVTSLGTYQLSNTTLLSGDGVPANDSLFYQSSCVTDTTFAWDRGTPTTAYSWNSFGPVAIGNSFTLSSSATLTSASVTWGSISGTPTGYAVELWNTTSGVPSTLNTTIASGITLSSANSFVKATYPLSTPVVLAAGTYFIAARSTVTASGSYIGAFDAGSPAFTATNSPRKISYINIGATWYETFTNGLYGFFMTRPNFALPIQPNDVGTYSVDVTDIDPPGGTQAPKATIKNFGSAAQTFTVNMTITGGYTSTKTVTSLAAGATIQVTFDNWTPTAGYPYVVNVCTQLSGDADPANDCMSKSVGVYTGAWTAGAVMPVGNYIGGSVGYTEVVDKATTGYLFALGGGLTPGTANYKYNVNTNTWSAIASFPSGISRFATAINGHYIYVMGGYDLAATPAQVSTVWKYDINNDAGGWVAVASLPSVLGWGRAVGHGNYVYLAGGVSGATYMTDVLVYDVNLNTWTAATPMTDGRFGGGFSCTGNTLVYVAGAAASGIINTVLKGDIDPGNPLLITWTLTTSPFPGNGNIYPKDDLSKTDLTGDINSKTVLLEGNKSNYPPGAMYRFEAAPWGTDGVIVAGGSPNSTWAPASPSSCFIYKPGSNTWVKQGDLVSPATPTTGAFSGTVQYGTTWKLIVSGGVTTGGLNTTATSIWTDVLSSPLNLGLTAMLS
jgi:hypothetical protein